MLTLILPIGGPGSGKTTLCQDLKVGSIPSLLEPYVKATDTFTYSCRDELYAEVRQNNSANKTRRILYDKFQEWIRGLQGKDIVAYLDSSNAQLGGRNHIIEQIKPDRVILINFRYPADILVARTMVREHHPTFPKEREEQLNIIGKVLTGLEYADAGTDANAGQECIVLEWE